MKQNNTHTPAATPHITEQDLESVATDLNHHAKLKLPDGCLSGILTGYEPDIRQAALLMALRWWVDHHASGDENWNARRSIAYAINFKKLQLVDKIERRSETVYRDDRDLRSTQHPYCLHELDYPEHSLLRMLDALIKHCLKTGTISNSNAVIARMSYMEAKTLEEIANTLGIHRSAVNQQLRRVRLALPRAANTTDPTFIP